MKDAKQPIRVLIADDHEIMRMGLASLLETDELISVVGEAADGEEAVRKAQKLRPDVVVMDLMMPVKDGSEATQEIKAALPETRILLLTTFGTADGIAHAIEAGAEGALLKSTTNSNIIKAIRALADGKQFISSEVKELLTKDPPVPELTERQRLILASITEGLTNLAIADRLGISEDGVKRHVNAIMVKLGADSRAEAVAIALRKHLLKI